jgi:hypothetical protein
MYYVQPAMYPKYYFKVLEKSVQNFIKELFKSIIIFLHLQKLKSELNFKSSKYIYFIFPHRFQGSRAPVWNFVPLVVYSNGKNLHLFCLVSFIMF